MIGRKAAEPKKLPGTVNLAALGRKAAEADKARGSGDFDRLVRRLGAGGYLTAEEVTTSLSADKSRPYSVKALCPLHETSGEHDPSLNVTRKAGDDGGVLIKCHGSCDQSDVWQLVVEDDPLPKCGATRKASEGGAGGWLICALDLRNSDDGSGDRDYLRWGDQESGDDPRVAREAATYIYRDREGREVAAKVRWEGPGGKTFAWFSKGDRGGWQRKLAASIPAYRTDEIVRGDREVAVWAVEGEKDADRLAEAGLLATSMKGPQKPAEAIENLDLAGRRLVIVPDDDDMGKSLAANWKRWGQNAGADVVVLPPLGVVGRAPGSGTDVSDWLDAGGTIQELMELVETAVGGSRSSDSETEREQEIEAASEVDDDQVIEGLSSVFSITAGMLKPEWDERAIVRVVREAEQKYFRTQGDELYRSLTGADDAATWRMKTLAGSMTSPKPDVLQLVDGGCLLYSGELNMIWGKKSAGKTWLADMAIREQVRKGRQAMLLDFENGDDRIRHRFRNSLALTEREYEMVNYVTAPAGGWPGEKAAGVRLDDIGIVVIDSMTGALRMLDLKSSSGDDVEKFMLMNVRPFMEAGICVLVLDHVTHNEEQHDRPKDSTHKLNRVQGAGYLASNNEPMAVGRRGWSTLTLYKDNAGGIAAATEEAAAHLIVDSTGKEQDDAVKAWLEKPPAAATGLAALAAEIAKQNDLIERLDEAGVPVTGKRETNQVVARAAGIRVGAAAFAAAQRERKKRLSEARGVEEDCEDMA